MDSFKNRSGKRAGLQNKVVYSVVERLLVTNFGLPVAMQFKCTKGAECQCLGSGIKESKPEGRRLGVSDGFK